MRQVLYAFLAQLVLVSTAWSEGAWEISCSDYDTIDEVRHCIESRLDQLAEIDAIFEKSLENQYSEVIDIINREIVGPSKNVILVPKIEFYNFSIFYKWRHRKTSLCEGVSELPTKNGYSFVGGEISEEHFLFGTNKEAFKAGFGKGTKLGSEGGGVTPKFYAQWPCDTKKAECGKKGTVALIDGG